MAYKLDHLGGYDAALMVLEAVWRERLMAISSVPNDFGMVNMLSDDPELFIAGLYLGSTLDSDDLGSWIKRMTSIPPGDGDRGFEYTSAHAGVRLCRVWPIESLEGEVLSDQANKMAERVASTFRLLAANPHR